MLLRGVLRRGGADFKTRMSLVQAGWDPYSSAKTVELWPPQPLGTCAKVKGIEEYLESKDAKDFSAAWTTLDAHGMRRSAPTFATQV